ncbi:MAG: hypothetical protein ACJ736_11335 [Streptomyces sp.]
MRISYRRWSGDFYNDKAIEELIAADGRHALTAGKAKGYASDTSGALFVPCPTNDDPESKVQIQTEYLKHGDGKEADTKLFGDLTVAAARRVAQDLLNCEGAESLSESDS